MGYLNMDILKICNRYFNGLEDIKSFKTNNSLKNVEAILKIISYISIVIPIGFGFAYLYGRISLKSEKSALEEAIDKKRSEILDSKNAELIKDQDNNDVQQIGKSKNVNGHLAEQVDFKNNENEKIKIKMMADTLSLSLLEYNKKYTRLKNKIAYLEEHRNPDEYIEFRNKLSIHVKVMTLVNEYAEAQINLKKDQNLQSAIEEVSKKDQNLKGIIEPAINEFNQAIIEISPIVDEIKESEKNAIKMELDENKKVDILINEIQQDYNKIEKKIFSVNDKHIREELLNKFYNLISNSNAKKYEYAYKSSCFNVRSDFYNLPLDNQKKLIEIRENLKNELDKLKIEFITFETEISDIDSFLLLEGSFLTIKKKFLDTVGRLKVILKSNENLKQRTEEFQLQLNLLIDRFNKLSSNYTMKKDNLDIDSFGFKKELERLDDDLTKFEYDVNTLNQEI